MWLTAATLGLVVVVATLAVLTLLSRVLPPGRTRELAGFVPNALVLMRRLQGDRRLPLRARYALGAAADVVSPVQLIPNFIPVIGQTDDVAAVVLAVRLACRQLPREEVEAAWPGDPAHLARLLGPVNKRRVS